MVVTAALPSTLTYEVSVSTQLVDLDLQRTLLKQWLSPHWFRVVDEGLRRWFPLIAGLWVATVGCCVVSLVHTDEPTLSILVSVVLLCTLAMLVLCCTLSVDVLWLLIQQYEFWFTTVFNTLYWGSLSLIFRDKRFFGCFFGWLHVQMALTIDANFSFHQQMARSAWMGLPGIVLTVVLALLNKLAGQSELEIVILGKTVGDLLDVLTLTSTTLIIFLLKILIHKQRTAFATRSTSSPKVIPCVVAKTTLRLCPSTSVVGSIKLRSTRGSVKLLRQPSGGIKLHQQKLSQIDAFDTVLPFQYWRLQCPTRLRSCVRFLYVCGILGFGLPLVQTCRDIYRTINSNGMARVPQSKRWYDHVITGGAFVGTFIFCSASVALHQRHLLWMLLRNFDFLFSVVQILILGVLFCDMSHWDIDRVLLNASWILWFLWALSLDAVTPMIRHQVLGISRNIAIPILLTMFIACINGTYKMTVMPFVFYNRTLWHHKLSPTRSISITTFDLFYGRVLTILLWCSRQVYRLMTRAPNELYLLHGHVDLVLKEEYRDSPRLSQIHPSDGPRKESTWATKSYSNEQT